MFALFRFLPFLLLAGLLAAAGLGLMRVAGLLLRTVLALAGAAIAAGFAGVVAASLADAFALEPSWLVGVLAALGIYGGLVVRHFRRLRNRIGAALGGLRESQPDLPRESDAALAAAWDEAAALVPRGRERLRLARGACARVGELASTGSLDPEVIDCAVFVRRSVPELVAATQAMLADAAPAARAELIEDLAADLEQVGRRARGEIARVRAVADDRRAAVRAHVAQRTGER